MSGWRSATGVLRAPRRERAQRARLNVLRRRTSELQTQVDGLERVLDSLGEGVIAVDRAGLVVHANVAAIAMLGMDPDRLLGHHMYAVVPNEEVCEALEATMRPDATSEPGSEREVVLATPAGEPTRLTVSIGPLRERGGGGAETEGAIAVLKDVTELRRLERARADFFTNVSHELKTPVTAIRGLVETVLEDEQMHAGIRTRFLRKAVGQANRLSALVSDLLALSRLEDDARHLDRKRVDVLVLARESLAAVGDTAQAAGVSLHLEPAAAGSVVDGDEEALRQAVVNLLTNAIAHAGPSRRVTLGVERAVGSVVVAVADDGVGIPPEHQERIFERFYRVDKDRSRERGGTGIGLSIVKHVALAHAGEVTVESEPGRGSTFRLRLPAAP